MTAEDRTRLSRRSFLRTAGGGIAALSLAEVLAACSSDEVADVPSETGGGSEGPAQGPAGEVTFVNWPFYIDKKRANGEATHPTLDQFTQETGIAVDYLEQITSYEEFHAKVFRLLENEQSTGYDLLITGFPKWYPIMMALGYLVELDASRLQNFTTYAAPKYRSLSYDPGNRFGVPYQSGITGLGYNVEMTSRELSSVQELFNPEWDGSVGMFRDTLDTPNMALIAGGVNPPDATEEDWRRAADLLTEQRDSGLVRQYYGQGYIAALQSKEVAISLAWSADVLQAQNSGYDNLRFVVPDEGGLLWTDIMAIPVGAEHPVDAMMLMDFLYRPDVAAKLTSWIQNVSPVPDAQQILRDQGDPVADNPLVFPTEDMYAKLRDYRVLDADESEAWDDLFLPIYQS